MEQKDYLPFFITEPVFVVKEDNPAVEKKTVPIAEKTIETARSEEPAPVEEVVVVEKQITVETPPTLISKNPIGVLVQSGIKQEEKAFIMKVLGAVKLSPNDIDLIEQEVTIDQLSGYEKIIDFGKGVVKQTTKYKITQHQTIKLLVSDKAGEIAQNVELKKQLWAAMQELFELK